MAGTEKDFKVKKGLIVSEGITLGGHTFNDIDIGTEHVDTDDHIMSSGAIKEYVDANAGGIASLADDDSPQLGANLDTAGYDITSTSNQHISITPHGTGDIQLNADTIRVGDSNADVTIAPNISSTTAKLQFQSDGDTLLRTASGTGNMYLNANSLMSMQAATFRFGTSGGNPTLTTLGTSDLTLNTNSGTNSGSIVIADGVDGQISITPNGAGTIKLDGVELDNSAIATGYVLKATSATAAGWAAESGGGASALNGLTDVIANTTNFTDSILISPDGAAPPQGGTLSSATNNVGIGKDVFSAGMTSGHSNVAIGTEAGKAVTTSHESVYIGHHSGKLQTYGSDNVGIGAFTLDAATSGGQNVAVGHSALSSVTGSNSNVAVGYFAGSSISNQTNNVFIGRNAGKSLNSAYNVIIGSMAGDGISNGGNNTLIGYSAGGAMSGAADSNICLGHNAGDNISTGDNNVVIGAADVPSATGDSQLSISSGDGGVTWITGNSSGGINSKAEVVAVTGTTQLTAAQSGSYVYVTGSGAVELPDDATTGLQYTIFNNKGSNLTVTLGNNNSIVSNWATNAAVSDNEATSYICVSNGNWVQIG